MSSFTILAVDDSEDDILLLRMAFRAVGQEVELRYALNGADALAVLEKSAGTGEVCPDLVLLDLNMPGMSGFEVLAGIRASSSFPGLPVVMFSSSQEPREVRQSYEWGANAYLMKPLDYGELVDVAKSLVRLLDEGDPTWDSLSDLACHRAGRSA